MWLWLWEETERRWKYRDMAVILKCHPCWLHYRTLTSLTSCWFIMLMVVTLCGHTRFFEICHYVGDVFFVVVGVCLYCPHLAIFIYLSGKNCSTSVSPCASDVEFCKNGGTCTHNFAGETLCICPPGIEQEHLYSRFVHKFVQLSLCFDTWIKLAVWSSVAIVIPSRNVDTWYCGL